MDKYTIQIAAQEARWRSFLQIGWGTFVYPARYIRMDGETYIRDWNWKLPPGTGPYELRAGDIDEGLSISIRRRPEWWRLKHASSAGLYSQAHERNDAKPVLFDPKRARELLAADGWTKRDGEGYLVNGAGERFPVLTLEYAFPTFARIHDVLREALWNEAGIELELTVVDFSNLLKKVWEYKFEITYFNWTGSLFPDPQFQFHSKFADRSQMNNLNGSRTRARTRSWTRTGPNSIRPSASCC